LALEERPRYAENEHQNRIAIGRGIDERQKGIRCEPLSKRLIDFIGRLSEAHQPESCTQNSPKRNAPIEMVPDW
jgi:hypothetical protein